MIWLAAAGVALVMVWAVVLVSASRCSSRMSEARGEREGDLDE